MKVKRLQLWQIISLVVLLFTIVWADRLQANEGECIASFDDFIQREPIAGLDHDNLPIPPWQVESVIPLQPDDYRVPPALDVRLSRVIDDYEEIWLYGGRVYRTDNQSWETISLNVEDTGLYATQTMFVDSKGDLWDSVSWARFQEYPDRNMFPVLSKFNDQTRVFEIAEGILEVPLIREEIQSNGSRSILSDRTRILLDNRDIFWIFAENDGLYRYDPVNQTTDKYFDLPHLDPLSAILAPDGTIYFDDNAYTSRGEIQLGERRVFQLLPDTGRILSVGRSLEFSPLPYSNLEIVATSRENWLLPTFMLESADGRLWYRNYAEGGGNQGAAWFDPHTGAGCMFTTSPSYIIADRDQNLWMSANEILYKYPSNLLSR